MSANLYAAQQDLEQAAAEFRATAEQRPGNPFWEASTDIGLGSLAALQGRLSEAEASYGRALSRLQAVGATSQYYFVVYNLAQLDLVVRSDTAAAIRRMDRALEALPLAALPPLDRPYLAVSGIYASAGETGRARQLLDSFERETPPELRSVQLETLRHAVLGAIAFAEGRYEEAAAQYRQGQTACEICSLPALALIHETTSRTDSVVATLEKYIEVPWAYRLTFDQFFLPLSYEWLGRLYEEQDDLQKAAENYAKFVELWVEADPELQPRVEAAQTRLEAIVRARG